MPTALIGLLSDTAGGLLFSLIRSSEEKFVPDPSLSARGEGSMAMLPHMSEWNDYVDTFVEVIDVKQSRVLVSQRFDSAFISVQGTHRGQPGPLVWRFVKRAGGADAVEVLALKFSRQVRRRRGSDNSHRMSILAVRRLHAPYTSKMPAAPMPPPIHIVTIP